ncbi:thioredoxin family protein [Lentisphaera marina]|uniref:thioredoxin family protein n=1 Tax=Lentisphaera marina TaxID=1111041 RepID=UPI0023665490|nr:thioredoxin family protein [Lentisphaera marina]MDD7984205.1 thioredoxin family protein [Lentisphaera marina]
MKKFLSLALCLFLSLNLFAGGDGWETNFEAAKQKASKENKALLVDFTGTDWCGWCIRLKEEVFDHKEFSDFANQHFILVEIDYPQKKVQSDEIKAQNEKLKNTYQIQGYPTILVMDAEGRPFAKTGYQAGGPATYNKHLTQLLGQGQKIKQAFAEAKKTSGIAQAKKLAIALESIPQELNSHYKAEMEMIFAADPEDTTGFKKAYELKSSLKALAGQVVQIARQGDISKAEKMVDDFISKHQLSGENKQKALLAKLKCYDPRKEGVLQIADKLMDEVIAIDANSQSASMAKNIKKQITQMIAQKKAQPQK